jgi:diadenosine tetraphosphate (Ap4A) HIT family hydrolase
MRQRFRCNSPLLSDVSWFAHTRRVDHLVAMAIYHLHVKVIGRKAGSSAVASAAYRRVDHLVAMAIYHLHVKVIGRKAGSSAVASAAYRSASRSATSGWTAATIFPPSVASSIPR